MLCLEKVAACMPSSHRDYLRFIVALLLAIFAVSLPTNESSAQGLPKSRSEATTMEGADALALTSFYDPPDPLPPQPAGTLIRSEPFSGYDLPTGASAVRILYYSRARDGRPVPASGVVLIPSGNPPVGGWPVIAWAHGTSGVARQCAPSLMRDLEYADEGLKAMLASGFAVVAPDYAGLGTPGAHEYDNKIAQANDVVYAVPAARAAVSRLILAGLQSDTHKVDPRYGVLPNLRRLSRIRRMQAAYRWPAISTSSGLKRTTQRATYRSPPCIGR